LLPDEPVKERVKPPIVQRKPQLPKLVSTIQRYGLAVLCVAVALGAALLLQQFNFRDLSWSLSHIPYLMTCEPRFAI